MLYRIEMHVIHMGLHIRLVTDEMFPKSPLPDASFASKSSHHRPTFVFGQSFRKIHFYQPPSRREIRVIQRQFNDAMHMLREHHPAVYVKWMPKSHRGDDISQQFYVTRQ